MAPKRSGPFRYWAGPRLRERRLILPDDQRTATQLAAKLKVSESTWYSWEKGETCPEAEQLPLVAAAVNTSVGYLLSLIATSSPDPDLRDESAAAADASA